MQHHGQWGSTGRSVLPEHKHGWRGGQRLAISDPKTQATPWSSDAHFTLGGYNLAGCCSDSGGMRMSSKNPRETGSDSMGQRLTTDSSTRRGLETQEASPLLCAVYGADVIMEICSSAPVSNLRVPCGTLPISLTHPEQPPKPEVDTTHDMDQWVLTTLSHLRPVRDPLRSSLMVKLTVLRSSPLHEHKRGLNILAHPRKILLLYLTPSLTTGPSTEAKGRASGLATAPATAPSLPVLPGVV